MLILQHEKRPNAETLCKRSTCNGCCSCKVLVLDLFFSRRTSMTCCFVSPDKNRVPKTCKTEQKPAISQLRHSHSPRQEKI